MNEHVTSKNKANRTKQTFFTLPKEISNSRRKKRIMQLSKLIFY